MKETRRFIRQYMRMIGFVDRFKNEITQEMFDEMDLDGNGLISQDELKDFLRNLHKSNMLLDNDGTS